MTSKSRQRDGWQELIEFIDSRKPQNVITALRARDRRLTQAWKHRPQESGLASLIRSFDCSIEDIAKGLVALYQPRQRKRGKPRGQYLRRMTRPHYLVAWMIEMRRAKVTDELVSEHIRLANDWAIMRGRRPLDPRPGSDDHLRVCTLLHGSKRRRL